MSFANSVVGTPSEKEKQDDRVYVPVYQRNAAGEYVPVTAALKNTRATKPFSMFNYETWARGDGKEIDLFRCGYSKLELLLMGTCTGENSLKTNGPAMFVVFRGPGYPLAKVQQVIDKTDQVKVLLLDGNDKVTSSTIYKASEFKVNTLLGIVNAHIGETYTRPGHEKQQEFDFLL